MAEKEYATRLEWLKDHDPEKYEAAMKANKKEWVRMKVPLDIIEFAETRFGDKTKGLNAMLRAQKDMSAQPEGKGARNALNALLEATQGSGGLISYPDMMGVIGKAIGTHDPAATQKVLASLMSQRYISRRGKSFSVTSFKQPDPVIAAIFGGF